MKPEKIYDIIGIGIGPFNLGLAALADSVPKLDCVFFEQKEKFSWHEGMLLPTSRLQVPFYADLVTLADPTNRFSYLNFLKAKERLFRFAIHENNFPTRREYNSYCQWVVEQLRNLHFGLTCHAIHYNKEMGCYDVFLTDKQSTYSYQFKSKHIVLGIGTKPYLPECASETVNEFILHSSNYLFKKDELLKKKNITIVGSGQSAAEIFYDLLQHTNELDSLNWITRSQRFFPMEYSSLSLEMTSPDYINYFYSLTTEQKKTTLKDQDVLFKAINYNLINDIYNELYLQSLEERKCKVALITNSELNKIEINEENIRLGFHHLEKQQLFNVQAGSLILATGYKYEQPSFLEPIKEFFTLGEDGKYVVNKNYSIDKIGSEVFVQNAELHTHGFNSADLGMGAYRNSVILNSILGYEEFSIENNIAFQTFGLPV